MDENQDIMFDFLNQPIFEEELKKEMLIRFIFDKMKFLKEIPIEKEIELLILYKTWDIDALESLDYILYFEVRKLMAMKSIIGQQICLN